MATDRDRQIRAEAMVSGSLREHSLPRVRSRLVEAAKVGETMAKRETLMGEMFERTRSGPSARRCLAVRELAHLKAGERDRRAPCPVRSI
jgi:hypothetical protein